MGEIIAQTRASSARSRKVAAMLFALLLSGHGISNSADRAQFWSHILLIHNFNADWIFGINGVFWSIAVEVQLYLLYPLVWLMRKRWGIVGVLKFTLGLSIASRVVAALFFTDWTKDLSGTVWTFPTMLWFDWTLGAFLAERYFNGTRAFPKSAGLRWLVLGVVVVATFFKPTAIFAFSLASCLFALVCESYLYRERAVSWMEWWLVPIGLCSYSLYLLHYPLIPLVAEQIRHLAHLKTELQMLAAVPAGIVILTAISFIAYFTIERGSIVVGRYIRNRQRPIAPTAQRN